MKYVVIYMLGILVGAMSGIFGIVVMAPYVATGMSPESNAIDSGNGTSGTESILADIDSAERFIVSSKGIEYADYRMIPNQEVAGGFDIMQTVLRHGNRMPSIVVIWEWNGEHRTYAISNTLVYYDANGRQVASGEKNIYTGKYDWWCYHDDGVHRYTFDDPRLCENLD